jgi:hypothetical protein
MFLSIGAVALFVVFIPTVTWLDSRRKEREAFYKAETLRRITEASGEGAKAAVELIREEGRIKRRMKGEGLKLGGLICVAVGAATVIFLRFQGGPYLAGLIPGFVGVAILVYVYFMSAPVEEEPKA